MNGISNSIVLLWDALTTDLDTGYSPVVYYWILSNGGSGTTLSEIGTSSSISYELFGVTSGEQYEFVVIAHNIYGDGPASSSVFFTVP